MAHGVGYPRGGVMLAADTLVVVHRLGGQKGKPLACFLAGRDDFAQQLVELLEGNGGAGLTKIPRPGSKSLFAWAWEVLPSFFVTLP